MKVKVYTDTIDYLSTNLLILPFFRDCVPLKGNLGLVDWRLNGFLSGLMMNGRIKQEEFEKILVPPFERIPADRVLLVCMGLKEDFSPSMMNDFTYGLLETAYKISYSSFAVSFPAEMDEVKNLREVIESCFRGIDKFAAKVGPCEFLENLRITFAFVRQRNPKAIEVLNKYLNSRSTSKAALINA